MHCLVQINDDKYEVLETSESDTALLGKQSTRPLRIVMTEKILNRSLVSKQERDQLRKDIDALRDGVTKH